MMEPFRTMKAVAAPLLLDNVDTDAIAPASADSRRLDPDYARLFFARKRWRADGSEDPAFVLNRGPFRTAGILVTGERFGCGSARETAVWALQSFGIRCIVARSFAEMYRENCLRNGILPVVLATAEQTAFEDDVVATDGRDAYTIDLHAQEIVAPGGRRFAFAIDPADRLVLLEGADLIALTLRNAESIDAWEAGMRVSQPWLQDAGS
jgi:3-isopropylmalate/(R)-2-methylmalate dehydratase small subunit